MTTEHQQPYIQSGITARLAHLISDVFVPLLAPTYGMIAAMWLTRLHYLPLGVRIWSTLAVLFITALIPITVIAILMRKGRVSDVSISDPNQRTIPYLTSILCYLGAATYLLVLHAEWWLVLFMVGGALVAALSMLITHWWKISAHTGGMGGLCGMILWMAVHGLIEYSPLVWVSVSILMTGLMAWSRLYLERHTLLQVAAGALMSVAVMYATMSVV